MDGAVSGVLAVESGEKTCLCLRRSFRETLTGPLALDTDHAARVTAQTLQTYRKCVGLFCPWLDCEGLVPYTAEQFDDLAAERKHSGGCTKKTVCKYDSGVENIFSKV